MMEGKMLFVVKFFQHCDMFGTFYNKMLGKYNGSRNASSSTGEF